jgi:hypothetical protein
VAETFELSRARARALRLYPRSAGFRNAYANGARAALASPPLPETACPYAGRDGGFSRAYRFAWLRGYRSVADAG